MRKSRREESRRFVPDDVRKLLDESGVPWEIQGGTKHFKILLGGRMIAIVPLSGARDKSRSARNFLAGVRRAIREVRP